MTCLRKCIERSNIRVVLGCPSPAPHGRHDWFSPRSGRHVHCEGVKQD